MIGILVFALGTNFAQKTTLIENFTQASCVPCVFWNPRIDDIMATNPDAILVRYQTSWPGFDPMHNQNEADPNARVDYYGVTAVPRVFFNGATQFDPIGAGIQNWDQWTDLFTTSISNGANEMTALDIKLTHDFSFDKKTADIKMVVTNTSADDFTGAGSVAHLLLLEKEIIFPEAPGSNSETEFTNVVRKMLPNAMGTPMADIAAGDSMVMDLTDVDVPDYLYNYGGLEAVAFIQNNNTKEVLQAAKSEAQAIDGPDAALTVLATAPTSYCDYDYAPKVSITNMGTADITEMTLDYVLNSNQPVSLPWTGTLAPGMTETFDFPAITLTPPSTVIQYAITSVNGSTDSDFNSLNDISAVESFSSLTSSPTREEVSEGFNISEIGEVPAGVILENPDNIRVFTVDGSISTAVSWPLGGFGNSDGCMRFDYYGIQSGQATLIMDQINLSNVTSATLVFSHAYAQSINEPDRLEVVISTDCGSTWSPIWDKDGAALATHPPTGDQSPRFYPMPTDWVQNVVDLSFLDGAPEVTVAFRGTSAWGNSLYLDDIQIGAGLVDAEDVNPLEGKVEFFPNPASDNLNIQITLEEASPISAEIFSLTGNRVATIETNATYPSGTHNLNWNIADQANGMYLVRVRTASGEITERVSILK